MDGHERPTADTLMVWKRYGKLSTLTAWHGLASARDSTRIPLSDFLCIPQFLFLEVFVLVLLTHRKQWEAVSVRKVDGFTPGALGGREQQQ